VWSSLNRIWSSSAPAVVEAICRALAEHSNPVAAVQADLARELDWNEVKCVRATAGRLAEVAALERHEHGL
jgi:hypothetical protein